jgi:Co/Zn/Cd efflux system component
MSDCCGCGKIVDVAALQARQRRVLGIVLAINLATFVMMAGAAWWSHSSSLLSGSLDNLGDALTYAISLAVVGASARTKGRVALLKGLLILGAALAVAVQIGWRLTHPAVPLFEGMGIAGALNLAANGVCLWLLTPFRHGDVNLASAWECSRNDIAEGVAVLLAALAVWVFGAGWPDLLIAGALLVMFLRSAVRVLAGAACTGNVEHAGGTLAIAPRCASPAPTAPPTRTPACASSTAMCPAISAHMSAPASLRTCSIQTARATTG